MSVVVVCGSRTWRDAAAVLQRLRQLPRGTIIVHGGARGADACAGAAARTLGFTERVYPADWRGQGRRAGILRNLAMLELAPSLLIAFWDGSSSGTAHMLSEARRRQIPVDVIVSVAA